MAKARLIILGVLLIGACLFFLTFNAHGNWDFVLPFRAKKLILLLLIAYTIGISTLLFQTLTQNPILTPGILGFDSLYLLMQSALVFFFDGIGFTQLDLSFKFIFETGLMIMAALLLFSSLTKNNREDLTRMILIGVIFGVLFRSLTNLLQRIIDPTEFAIAQGASFASFNSVKPTLLWFGSVISIISALWIWRQRHKLDLLLLGQNKALSLGIHYGAFSRQILLCCAILVSISTALVGPILFLGLLVCAIGNALSPTFYHAVRLPMIFFVSAITLVLGQSIFEQVLNMQGVLSVVIEFLGGIIFIYLILRRKSL